MPLPNDSLRWFIVRVCQAIILCGLGLALGILIAYLMEV